MKRDAKAIYDQAVGEAARKLDDTVVGLAREQARKLGAAIRAHDEAIWTARRAYRGGGKKAV